MTTRVWGANQKTGEHVIADISVADGVILCVCASGVQAARGLTLEDAWDIHRGRADLVSDRLLDPEVMERADDAEVSAFLGRAGEDAYEFDPDE